MAKKKKSNLGFGRRGNMAGMEARRNRILDQLGPIVETPITYPGHDALGIASCCVCGLTQDLSPSMEQSWEIAQAGDRFLYLCDGHSPDIDTPESQKTFLDWKRGLVVTFGAGDSESFQRIVTWGRDNLPSNNTGGTVKSIVEPE